MVVAARCRCCCVALLCCVALCWVAGVAEYPEVLVKFVCESSWWKLERFLVYIYSCRVPVPRSSIMHANSSVFGRNDYSGHPHLPIRRKRRVDRNTVKYTVGRLFDVALIWFRVLSLVWTGLWSLSPRAHRNTWNQLTPQHPCPLDNLAQARPFAQKLQPINLFAGPDTHGAGNPRRSQGTLAAEQRSFRCENWARNADLFSPTGCFDQCRVRVSCTQAAPCRPGVVMRP